MNEQREVVAFLSHPASYGDAGATVERVTTHCSIVFLVGERAFKLKRAVRFSYLDYSTVALREKYCRAELALNRRTAPAIYLGVRSVTRDPDGTLAFDGSGSTVDWVLEMRRFDETGLFDRMAEAERLRPELMRNLADHIAEFHRAAEVIADRGGRAGLETALSINDDNLRLGVPPLDGSLIDDLRALSQARLGAVGDLLEARRKQGSVRRCHGDLHLRNICLVSGQPTLFDAIEFNDDFACIDVLYDLAFLLMDLTHRGLAAFASIVFNRYLDRTGDHHGLAAMPLFLATRAAVRAHVMAATAGSDPNARTASEAAAQAESYLALARMLLKPQPARLIAVGGLSGTGKSTVAQSLAPGLSPAPGARVVRSDVVRKRLAGVAPETRLPRESYTLAASRRVYDLVCDEARAIVEAGYAAIVDAAFLRAEEREAIAATAREAGVAFVGLWLEAPAATLARRLETRRGDASDADRGVLEQQLRMEIGAIDWLRIDASEEVAATVDAARTAVSATAGPARSSS